MEYTVETLTKLVLNYEMGDDKSTHVQTKFSLNVVGECVDRSEFLDEEELPTSGGSIAATECLIQGLVGNIHYAHQKAYRDSAEHLRYIISRLEEGFIAPANIGKDFI
jgi:hypothetical protein